MSTITSVLQETRRFTPSDEFRAHARVKTREDYEALYVRSIQDPNGFWLEQAQTIPWMTPPTRALEWEAPHAKWFADGALNASVACLDRWRGTPIWHKAALVWEGEPIQQTGEPEVVTVTYAQLYAKVVKLAAKLKRLGIHKGDRVAIYMGMVPEVVVAMLACARIGAPHTVVFGGFAADALRDRINDCQAKALITQDIACRRGTEVKLFDAARAAAAQCPSLRLLLVHTRKAENLLLDDEAFATNFAVPEARQDVERFLSRVDLAPSAEASQPTPVEAEHPLFVLYTSGSTGKPKGVLHTTAGYMIGAHLSTKYVFDLREDDLFFCTADVGWVTGHSYIVYGPLSAGATCLMYEGAPNWPRPDRLWEIIERHRATILYTAPTAIRAFIRTGEEWPAKHDMTSLRLLGTVGEPINPEAWLWYHRVIGGGRCPIVDTWWQTETGSIAITTLPGAVDAKPGSAGLPFFGIVPRVVDQQGQEVARNAGGKLILESPWPSMLRTVWGDDARYASQYWSDVPHVYTTGDGARQDEDGYFWVVGRIDDVLNVAGHRLGTAEVESALVSHPFVAEAAAVGRPDEIKGQALVVFVTLKAGAEPSDETRAKLLEHVAREIGKFARPDALRFAASLPKTRSGKIMRRLLKDLAAGIESKQDTSTLEDLNVLAALRGAEE
ncbi:MAG: acetate--CoA ligase [Deltaproteobacteria bacterium]|nr:acetate--CoA ligase [Deltaproteobacteria bacterium]